MIGWVCKRGDALSLPVLIARLNLIALMIHVRDLVRQPLQSGSDPRTVGRTKPKTKTVDALRLSTRVSYGCRSASATAVDQLAERCAAPVWWFERCAQNPIPSRTRPLNAPAPMVLCLKTRESRSPPDLHSTSQPLQTIRTCPKGKTPWRGVEQPGSSSGS